MLYQVKNSTLNKEIHIPFPGAFKAEYEKVCHNCPVKKGYNVEREFHPGNN